MVATYQSLGRRNFLRAAFTASAGFVVSPYMFGAEPAPLKKIYAKDVQLNEELKLAGEAKKAQEQQAKDPFNFRCYFNVHIFGRGWVRDNPKKVAEFPEAVRKRLDSFYKRAIVNDQTIFYAKETIELITIDFEPKELVKFDMTRGLERKPLATNVRQDNYQRLLLPRENGFVTYHFKVNTPSLDGQKFESSYLFMSNEGIVGCVLEEPNNKDTQTITPFDTFSGLYPRAFSLEFRAPDKKQRANVSYIVYGLESLFGLDINPNDFAQYYQNRKQFPDFKKFQEYRDKNLVPPLEVSPEFQVK